MTDVLIDVDEDNWTMLPALILAITGIILAFALAFILGAEGYRHNNGECQSNCEFCKTEQRRDAKLVKENTHTIIVKDER